MSSPSPFPTAAETPERLAFYERISRKHMTPLWVSLAKLVTPEPVSACQPAAWSFADIRAAMMEAGGLDHRQGSRAPRADSRESRACAGSRRSRPTSMPASSWCCRARWRPLTAMRRVRCASCSRATARTRPSTANARRCTTATSSSRRRWPGTTTATRRTSRCSGSTGSTFRSCSSSTPRLPTITTRTSSRSRGPWATRTRASVEPAAGRSPADDRRVAGLQLSVRAHARGPGDGSRGRASGTRATASRCATAIR